MTKSLQTLLAEIVDYAGLFPPAQLGMAEAVKNYAEYIESENRWMLGRFILPVSRFAEFEEEAVRFLSIKKPMWKISAIAGDDLEDSLKEIAEFNSRQNGLALVDSIEVKVPEGTNLETLTELIPESLTAYFEAPASGRLDYFTRLALTHKRAKLRTGGVTQDAFPASEEIVKFIRMCLAANVPFKATAGLHHPLRCKKPLTYEENAIVGTMHGFLNLFLTACFLRVNMNDASMYEMILDGDVSNFEFTDEGISWKGRTVDIKTIELARKRNALSFGSCSFTEPIEDLKELGLL